MIDEYSKCKEFCGHLIENYSSCINLRCIIMYDIFVKNDKKNIHIVLRTIKVKIVYRSKTKNFVNHP